MPNRYGNFYFCVKVPKAICPDGEIYVYADDAEIDSTGCLIFKRVREAKHLPNIAFAPGRWLVFFAASLLDGSAITVEHWTGEVNRGHETDY